jgi:NAD-dependent dihydropyrimidine dehydrogenase PreA subunit
MIDFIDESKCTGCGKCVENCPMDVFRLDAGKHKAIAAYPNDCQTCFCCEIDCPENAITIGPLVKQAIPVW